MGRDRDGRRGQGEELSWQREHRAELQALFHEWDGETDFDVFMDHRTNFGWSAPRAALGPLVPATLLRTALELVAGLHGQGAAATPGEQHGDGRPGRDLDVELGLVAWSLAAALLAGVATAGLSALVPWPAAAVMVLVGLAVAGTTGLLPRLIRPADSRGAREEWTQESQAAAVRAAWGDRADVQLRRLMKLGGWNPNRCSADEFVHDDPESFASRGWRRFKAQAQRAVELSDALQLVERSRTLEQERAAQALRDARAIIHERRVPQTVSAAWDSREYVRRYVGWQDLDNGEIEGALKARPTAAAPSPSARSGTQVQ
jgi:hypothetical protein